MRLDGIWCERIIPGPLKSEMDIIMHALHLADSASPIKLREYIL